MSRYTPIWEELKLKGKCSIAVPPALQKRVIKAVIKAKDGDKLFKFIAAEQNKKYKLEYKVESSKVTFTLHATLTVNALLGF